MGNNCFFESFIFTKIYIRQIFTSSTQNLSLWYSFVKGRLKKIMKKSVILLLAATIVSTQATVCAESCFSKFNKKIANVFCVKKYKDISGNRFAVNELKLQAQYLGDNDQNIISKYVFGAVRGEDTFLLMNGLLRGNLGDYITAKDNTKPLHTRLNYYKTSLYSTLTRTHITRNIMLYASIDNKYAQHLLKNKNIQKYLNEPVSEELATEMQEKMKGFKYTEKGFILASYDKNYTDKTKLRLAINAPKNLQAILIEGLGEKSDKKVLINCGYKWQIIGITKVSKGNQSYYRIEVKLAQ